MKNAFIRRVCCSAREIKNALLLVPVAVFSLSGLFGCATPDNTGDNTIHPDQSPLQGALTSQDIRTVASQMCPAILGLPEISAGNPPVRILISDFKNNTRFLIDKNLFAKRLRVELNQFGKGKLRFIDRNANVQADRLRMLRDRQEEDVQQTLKSLGAEIAALDIMKEDKPVKIAVIPVLNTNLVNLNADSFSSMLRSEIVQAGKGRIQFLMPGTVAGADYYLTGQFIPESMKKEGIVNLANYIEVIDCRLKNGKSMELTDNGTVQVSADGVALSVQERESQLVRMMRDPALRANPNVNKRLNVMLVKPDSKVAVYEKMFLLDRKFSDRSGHADYILSGEISALSQRRRGAASDYLLITVQLVDPESNEMIWEGAYETKRISNAGIVYQ